MPIDLSNLSTKDITATTAAMEAAWRIHEESVCQEIEARRQRVEVEAWIMVETKNKAEWKESEWLVLEAWEKRA
jgi:hypothetical protein